MNLNRLPCVNTLLLNRYMKELDWEASRDEAIEDARTSATAAVVTEDDVYEFACSLEYKDRDAVRTEMAALIQAAIDAKEGADKALTDYIIGQLNYNRAERAEQRFWDAQ